MYHEILPSSQHITVLRPPPEWTEITPFPELVPTQKGMELRKSLNVIRSRSTGVNDRVILKALASDFGDVVAQDLGGLHSISKGVIKYKFVLIRGEQEIDEEPVDI